MPGGTITEVTLVIRHRDGQVTCWDIAGKVAAPAKTSCAAQETWESDTDVLRRLGLEPLTGAPYYDLAGKLGSLRAPQ